MSLLSLRQITKTFLTEWGSVQAIRGINLEVEEGEFFTLLGPSGCGKTTALRCIAGLETPDSGEILLNGQLVYSSSKGQVVPVFRRDIGIVFQSYAIWPHMNVFQNVAYPLQHGTEKRFTKQEIRAKVSDALALVHLDGLEGRPAPQLSGGQQQRVALARALIKNPKLLLLDEPLSNLDAKLREEMRFEVRDLIKRLTLTAVYVTHDQLEALAMSDRIAVMQEGRMVQTGASQDIYRRPANAFVAGFIGATNFVKGRFRRGAGDETCDVAETEIGPLLCSAATEFTDGEMVRLAIRPEAFEVLDAIDRKTANARGTVNIFEGDIESLEFQGDSLMLRVRVGTERLHVKALSSREIALGEHVVLVVRPKDCRAIAL